MEQTNVVRLEPKPEPNRLQCTSCGATTDAPCMCGVPYNLLKASKKAEIGVKETPHLSNRAIADRVGVSDVTVGKARKQLQNNFAVGEPRMGLDGKERTMPEPKQTFDWTPEKDAEVMRLHKEGKGDAEIAEIFGITQGAASGRKHRLMNLRPDLESMRLPPKMPEDIYQQVVVLASQARARMFEIDALSAYVEQMHEDLRHEFANEVKGIHELSRDIIRRLVGGVNNIKYPAACGVEFKIRKED